MPRQSFIAALNIRKNCIECDAEFHVTSYNKICCSPACSYERLKKVTIQRYREENGPHEHNVDCHACGKVFVAAGRSYHRKTCSEECRKRFNAIQQARYRREARQEDPELYALVVKTKKLAAKQAASRAIGGNDG